MTSEYLDSIVSWRCGYRWPEAGHAGDDADALALANGETRLGLPDSQINREDLVMESVDEPDDDLLLVEELCASNEFLRLFLNAATPPGSFVARHSINREDGSGETDIEVEVTWTNEKHQKTSAVLLIENKIDAPFQPDQPERYAAYRDLLMETSPATLALTVLSAPGRCLSSTDAQFDARVSYEADSSFLQLLIVSRFSLAKA